MGDHEYEPGDVFYDIETAADAAADEVLEEDAAMRAVLEEFDVDDEVEDPFYPERELP